MEGVMICQKGFREAIQKKREEIRTSDLKVGGGQFENLIFLKLKIGNFLPGGRGSESESFNLP